MASSIISKSLKAFSTILLLFFVSLANGQDAVPSIEDVGTSTTQQLEAPPKVFENNINNDSVYFYQIYYKPMSLALVSKMNTDSFRKDSLVMRFYDRYKSANFDFTKLSGSFKRTVDSSSSPARIRPNRSNWMVYLLFFILAFFVTIKYSYLKDFKNINDGFWTLRGINLLIREDNLLNSRASALFFLLFSFTYALVIYNLCTFYGLVLPYSGFRLYLFFVVSIAAVFFIRTIVLLLLGFIFSTGKMFKSYIIIIYTGNYVFTIYLLPLLVIYTFLPTDIASKLFVLFPLILVGNLLIQYLRGTSYIVSHFKFPKIYLIVYLCAFEIAPLLLLIKSFAI